MAQTQKAKPETARRISGPRAVYRHKVRAPVSLLLTPEGHSIMGAELLRTGYSRSDYFEKLLRTFKGKLSKMESSELGATGT